jgi:predicted HTH domain antitoxin
MEQLGVQPRELVEAGLFASEADVIEAALGHLFKDRPELRIAFAIFQYERGEATLMRAAQLAGVHFERMKEILIENGVELRLGPATIEEAREEVATMRRWFRDRSG